MAGNRAVYEMSLRDLSVITNLNKAESAANKTEMAIGRVSSTLKSLATGATTAIAGAGLVDFLKGSVEAFNESAKASAQLETTLKSTAGAIGLTKQALDDQAASLMSQSLYDDDEITAMQSVLGTFTKIRGAIYSDAVPAVLDLSAKMGQDLQSSAVQVGKALNDPIKGVTALQRVGVSFTESQKKVIKSLAETGHIAEAQKMILSELSTEFGGSAAAAASAGTGAFTVLQHQFQNVREQIGELITNELVKLKPEIESLITHFSNFVKTISDNSDEIVKWGKVILSAAGWIGGYKLVVFAVTKAEAAWMAIQKGLQIISGQRVAAINTEAATLAEMTAAVNVAALAMERLAAAQSLAATTTVALYDAQGMVVSRVPILAAGVNSVTPAATAPAGGAAAGLLSRSVLPVFIIGMAGDILARMLPTGGLTGKDWSLWRFLGANEHNPLEFADLATSMAKLVGIDPMGDFMREKTRLNSSLPLSKSFMALNPLTAYMMQRGLSPYTTGKAKISPLGGDSPSDKVTGQKILHINITIDNMVREFNVQTTTLREAPSKVKEHMTRALLDAVNDAEILAGD